MQQRLFEACATCGAGKVQVHTCSLLVVSAATHLCAVLQESAAVRRASATLRSRRQSGQG